MILRSNLPLSEAIIHICSTWAESRSKDPSTKVGACIYDKKTGGLFLGYNGLPAGVADEEDLWTFRGDGLEGMLRAEARLTKYDLVIHAEVNAVRKALMGGVDVAEATLFCTHVPCAQCMKNVVLANGIRRVIYLTDKYASRTTREDFVVSELAKLGGVSMEKLTTYFDARNAALEKLEK